MSRSTSRTRLSNRANSNARFIASRVLPLPALPQTAIDRAAARSFELARKVDFALKAEEVTR